MTTAVLSPEFEADRHAPPPVAMGEVKSTVNWLGIAQVLCLVLLPFLCYSPALNGAFVWDDDVLITNSPLVRMGGGLWHIWFSTVPLDYFPLTNTSFWLEWQLWGDNTLGYHLVNLALHITSALLLWRLLRKLQIPAAWLAALIFAIHPLNVASVAWIAERKNVLSMVFYLGSLICYVQSEKSGKASTAERQYVAALGFFVLAMLSKSSVVMLPCALLLLAWWQHGRVDWRDVWRSAPFFCISLLGGLATIWFQHHRTMTHEDLLHANPLFVRGFVAAHAILFYLGKFLWPMPLSMLYPRWELTPLRAGEIIWPVALAALLVAAWAGRRRWGRGPVTALGYAVLVLLPVSGLVHMSYFTYSNVSDHLAYLAVPALAALASAGLAMAYAQGGTVRAVTLGTMVGIVCLLSLGCYQRADQFSSPEKLWRSTLEVDPQSFAAHNNLGTVFLERKDLWLAEGHFRAAMRIDPKLDSAGTNLANVFRMEGRYRESAALYRKILDEEPEAKSYNNYGVALLELGENTQARDAFNDALHLAPDMSNAAYNLYRLALSEHHIDEAGSALRQCLRINPDDVPALMALVSLNLNAAETVPITPAAAEALAALAQRACTLTAAANPKALGLLAEVLHAGGHQAEALKAGRRALTLAQQTKQTELADQLDEFLRTMPPQDR